MSTHKYAEPRLSLGGDGWVLRQRYLYVRPPFEGGLLQQGDAHIVQFHMHQRVIGGTATAPCGKAFIFNHTKAEQTHDDFYDEATGNDIYSFTRLKSQQMVDILCPTCYAKLEELLRDELVAPIARRKERLW